MTAQLGNVETTIVTATKFTAPAPLPDTATPVPEQSSMHYFLKIDGITGDSTDAQHRGEFTVDGFSLGSTNTVNSFASGGGAGRATFSPLTVDISSVAGLAPLLADEASGKVITSVELIGVTNDGNQTVYDIKLSNAVALMVQQAAGLDTSLAFDFQKVTLTDHGVTTEGTLGPAQTTIFGAHNHLTAS